MQILIDLEANLGRFWEGFGGQVGPKLAYLGGLILSYLTLSDQTWGGCVLSYLTLVILGILASRGWPTSELWGQTADNRPRNQQTNKPTRQQTNTTTSNKSRNEPPNQPKDQKINQKST